MPLPTNLTNLEDSHCQTNIKQRVNHFLELYLPSVKWLLSVPHQIKIGYQAYRSPEIDSQSAPIAHAIQTRQQQLFVRLTGTLMLTLIAAILLPIVIFAFSVSPEVALLVSLSLVSSGYFLIKAEQKIYNKLKSGIKVTEADETTITELKTLLGIENSFIQTKSWVPQSIKHFHLRWTSGDTNPLANQKIVWHAKRSTHAISSSVIGAVFGGGFATGMAFFGLPLFGQVLSLETLLAKIGVTLLGTVIGGMMGYDVGKDFSSHRYVNPEKSFNLIQDINHAGRWKIKRYIRFMVLALSFYVLSLTGLPAEANLTISYSIAGLISAISFMPFRKRKNLIGENQPLLNSAPEDVILINTYTLKENLNQADLVNVKQFWLELYQTYKTKLDHTRLSDAIAHAVFLNIRFVYEKLREAASYSPENRAMRAGYTLIKYLFLNPISAFFIFSLPIGLTKSIIDGVLFLPVINHLTVALQKSFKPEVGEPASLNAINQFFLAFFRFVYSLSPIPNYHLVAKAHAGSSANKAVMMAHALSLWILDWLAVGDNSWENRRTDYLQIKEFAQSSLAEITKLELSVSDTAPALAELRQPIAEYIESQKSRSCAEQNASTAASYFTQKIYAPEPEQKRGHFAPTPALTKLAATM